MERSALPEAVDAYRECSLALELGVKLRLYGIDSALYPTPRAVRWAVFMGMGLCELDFPASHGQEMLAYARAHHLPMTTLFEAFGSAENIVAFRNKGAHGMSPDKVKKCANELVYGSGLDRILRAHGVSRLLYVFLLWKPSLSLLWRYSVRREGDIEK